MPKQPVTVELFYDGAWQDATGSTRTSAGISIERGLTPDSQEAMPGRCELRFGNRDGAMNPGNAESPLYGLVGRNTPLRVALTPDATSGPLSDVVDTFTRSSASGWGTANVGGTWAHYWSGGTFSATDWDVDGSVGRMFVPATVAYRMSVLENLRIADGTFALTFDTFISNVTGGAIEPGAIIIRHDLGADDYVMFRPEISAAEVVTANIYDHVSGNDTLIASATISRFVWAGQPIRVMADARGGRLRMKVYDPAGTVPAADVWDVETTTEIIAPGAFGVRNGVASGNTNTKPIEFRIDDIAVTVEDARLVSEVADWRPARTIEPIDGDRGDAWVDASGAGILRRLGQGQKPLRSPLYRAAAAGDALEYWPLDDGRDATSAASGLAGGTPMGEVEAVSFSVLDGPPGAPDKCPQVVTDSAYTGSLVAPVAGGSSSAWTVQGWAYAAREAGTTFGSAAVVWIKTTGTYADQNGGWRIIASDEDTGPSVAAGADSSAGSPPGDYSDLVDYAPGEWMHWRLSARQDTATTCTVEFYVNDTLVRSETGVVQTIGRITQVTVGANSIEGFAVGPPFDLAVGGVAHVTLHNAFSPASTYTAGTGHRGETAADRFARLAGEEGIAATVVGDPDDSEPMGPQPAATLLDILRECARTDAALLYETRTGIGLSFRVGRDLYNQDPRLELSYLTGVAPPLEPVIGDAGTRNDVLAANRGGSSARAVLDTGAMSTQPPPAGVGRYDTQLDVNASDDARLPDLAGWHLHVGTVDEIRWRTVTVDLDAYPALAGAVSSVDIGDRVTVGDLPADDSPDDASLLALKVAETIGSHRRMVTFFTVPASPYEIGIVGENDGSSDLRGQAIDTDASTLATGIDGDDTALSVASAGGVLWTTDGDDWNTGLNGGGLFIRIGGEDMRITNIAGASSPQTFTVVRSVNGVVKSHASGAAVHVRYPVVVGR